MNRTSNESGWMIRAVMYGAVLALAAFILVPNFVKARMHRSMHSCSVTLMWMEAAKQQWAAENKKGGGDTPTEQELRTYMARVAPRWGGRKISAPLPFDANGKLNAVCPSAGAIRLGPAGERTSCTIMAHFEEDHFQECYREILKQDLAARAK